MSELHLRSQIERLTIAETLLAGVWEEVRLGCVQDGALQLAVNCQIDINRIVWKLNEQPTIIKNAPTIEADIKCEDCKTIIALKAALEPVKRGKWIGKPIAGYSTVRCSVCKEAFTENTGRWNYCPNCGARMEKSDETD